METLRIAYDREDSTEMDARYFVYDNDNAVVYKGSYAQCLCVVGGVNLGYTLDEINSKSNGFISNVEIDNFEACDRMYAEAEKGQKQKLTLIPNKE